MKIRVLSYYVRIGPDAAAGATALTLRSCCYISRYSGVHHAKVWVGYKAHFNTLLLLGDAQYLVWGAFYTTKVDGIGMGLTISRSIIEAHGGRLWAVATDWPGSTFCFSLPIEEAPKV